MCKQGDLGDAKAALHSRRRASVGRVKHDCKAAGIDPSERISLACRLGLAGAGVGRSAGALQRSGRARRARTPLVPHIEELVAQALAPRAAVEPRLERPRAVEIARRAPPAGPPPNELVQAALWLHGLVEPPPHLIVVTMADRRRRGAAARRAARRSCRACSAAGSYRRVGVAAEAVRRRDQRGGGAAGVVRRAGADPARAAGGRRRRAQGAHPARRIVRPEVLVTGADGEVTQLFARRARRRQKFTASLRCRRAGATRSRSPARIASARRCWPTFPSTAACRRRPSWCAGQRRRAAQRGRASPTRPQAEAALASLVNADRARAGLAPLELDPRLVAGGARALRGHGDAPLRRPRLAVDGQRRRSPARGAGADAQLIARERRARLFARRGRARPHGEPRPPRQPPQPRGDAGRRRRGAGRSRRAACARSSSPSCSCARPRRCRRAASRRGRPS